MNRPFPYKTLLAPVFPSLNFKQSNRDGFLNKGKRNNLQFKTKKRISNYVVQFYSTSHRYVDTKLP